MTRISACPNCDGSNLYRTDGISAGGGHAPNFLPQLGTFWVSAKFDVVVCRDCGLTRFFASADARRALGDGKKKWRRV